MNHHIRLAEAKLRMYEQEHVLKILARLPDQEKNILAAQIMEVDFVRLNKALAEHNQPKEVINDTIDTISAIPFEDWEDFEQGAKAAYTERGWELLRAGKVGVIVVAGGQGSRLGHEGPKGTLDIGLPSQKSLFQLQAERLLYLSRKAGKSIPWYIMTSPDNHEETTAFFHSLDYFGYPAEDFFFFQQNTMPALGHDGKLLLTEDGTLMLAPSGNGECFASLKRSGAIADMKRRGLEWLFYYNVDNALIKVADPAFIGVAAARNHMVATKVIEKTDVDEKIGILCLKNERPAVLEYNEIPAAIKDKRTKDGKLFYNLGHISIHVFKFDFIEDHADADIPFHAASKKMKYMDAEGNMISPTEPNAYKLERFIFDFFPLADQLTILRGTREEEFAPVKNKTGEDSPHSARKLVLSLHRNWLRAAGVPEEQLHGRDIEISPLISYDGEGLKDWNSKF
ncbi:UDPGP type 1 family protein [Bacillus sp. FJAT-28004]|uniref:UDPGP type 1 family protein n=1 Tax=Bacillus sp. FJAT-28004 TaxID=1679165 RepID=UPI000A53695E|nr:UDPGP type 1 family protein [Bacillus sp. FJAT-28004]